MNIDPVQQCARYSGAVFLVLGGTADTLACSIGKESTLKRFVDAIKTKGL